ncbi:hypothetical protein FJ934_09670 [Mesorhizobium sp. B2-4-12]|uniref:hypothetical protein n=1 Tax=unclassified Mesorhizobium TaxID=325217 RepID=UPI00112D1C4D|nr:MULTISPECIES: hypothetical protein [unclassified Mesorhizobium]TPK83468.1 hypothetical protein FJ548_18775 [Mesorhizobium sp. B2-4-17]TPK96402.1 hypothetical protein FJ934_09670 [Mesorhizobium sp. B2-4-12]TPL05314.1 hypothetical protein FJ938_15260 [Mesorhizobium sp. B2-4-14]
MDYYYVQPFVAGDFGKNTVIDNRVHPPIVHKLHYMVDVWIGDVLIRRFPCYLVTKEAEQELLKMRVTGATFAEVEVTGSELFRRLQPETELPPFVWMKIHGRPGHDDFGMAPNHELVVSESALDVFERLGNESAGIRLFDAN